jgi:hypothetical protein
MEIPRLPSMNQAAPAAPAPTVRSEDPAAVIRPVAATLPTGGRPDSVQIALFAGRGIAALVLDIRRALSDAQPERRREGLRLLRAIAGHPAAHQLLPDLQQLWERAGAAERREAEACLRALTGRGVEQWTRAEADPATPREARGDPTRAADLLAHSNRAGIPQPAPGTRESTRPDRSPATASPDNRELGPPNLLAAQQWLIQTQHTNLTRAHTLAGGALLAAGILVYLVLR